MSTLENKALVRRLYEGIAAKNINVFDELCAETFVDHNAAPNVSPNREGAKALFRQHFDAFPDMKMEIVSLVAEGDRVGINVKVTATHLGSFAGVPPTGRSLTVGGFDWMRVKDGKVVERWGAFDMANLMAQLGLAPGPTSADLKAMSRRYYETIDKTRGDLASIKTELLHPQMTVQFSGRPVNDIATFQQLVGGFYAAFPDLVHVIEDQIAEGDTVFNRITVKGTHKAEFAGVKATNKTVSVIAVSSHRYADGKIYAQSVEADFVGLMTQLGAIPTPS